MVDIKSQYVVTLSLDEADKAIKAIANLKDKADTARRPQQQPIRKPARLELEAQVEDSEVEGEEVLAIQGLGNFVQVLVDDEIMLRQVA